METLFIQHIETHYILWNVTDVSIIICYPDLIHPLCTRFLFLVQWREAIWGSSMDLLCIGQIFTVMESIIKTVQDCDLLA